MLPDRSRTISASGATDVAKTASSPVTGVAATATPGRNTIQNVMHMRKARIFVAFMGPPYLYMVEISMGPYPTPTPTFTLLLYSLLVPVTPMAYRFIPQA
jgi:hypothetical protein